MVIDFTKIDLHEQPVLVLRNADGTALQTLGYAFNLEAEINYDEISTITFDIPAYIEGVKTPGYDLVIGTRIIDVVGWGQFVLIDPSANNDGIREIKSCKGYSLEYELTYKKMSLPENTYNFWNPLAPEDTIIGIILSYLPSWKVGSIDDALMDKYRTFEENSVNIYNFIKSTVQKTYGCIFEFDTYERKINVRAVSSYCPTSPVYISLNNLAKSIEVTEDTENIFTVLDVNGADGVDIRSVNPMGTNKIYNLDYYMNTSHFSQDMIDKWNRWKENYNAYQLSYYNLTIEQMLITSAILNEDNNLYELEKADLASLENKQSVLIQAIASTDPSAESYDDYKLELATINDQIKGKKAEISTSKGQIASLKEEKDKITAELVEINQATSFDQFFGEDELLILDRYFKEDSIEDSTFVAATAESYIDSDKSHALNSVKLSFTGADVQSIEGLENKELYTIKGGSISGGDIQNTKVINACLEKNTSGEIVLSAYLSAGTIGDMTFASGCMSLTGSAEITHSSQSLTIDIGSGRLYFTKNTTEYEEFSVEWELFEYGHDCLKKLCYPSYSFDVSSANFFAIDDFKAFVNALQLGRKTYLELDEDKVLQPIFTGFAINFEDLSSLSLKFGDKYSSSDSTFSLVDLLDKSISMGKTVDTSRFSYNSFIDSGASTAVKEFIESALDVSKNAILSSSDIGVSWDSSGIKCRKIKDNGEYGDHQLAIINNSIVFTDDNWQSAKMAIGHFNDPNFTGELWGVVAPSVVGTLLAGESLIIESTKRDGEVSVFRVDGNGAMLHNAQFEIVKDNRHILLDPALGFGMGKFPIVDTETGKFDIGDKNNPGNCNFWIDTNGDVHLKGTLEGCDGKFSGSLEAAEGTFRGALEAATGTFAGSLSAATGTFAGSLSAASGSFSGDISAASGTFKGTIQAAAYLDSDGNNMMNSDEQFLGKYLTLKGITIKNDKKETTFSVDGNGNVTVSGTITMDEDSTIYWGDNGDPSKVATQASENAAAAIDAVDKLVHGEYSTTTEIGRTTFISGSSIYSPTISSPNINAGSISSIFIDASDITGGTIDGTTITGGSVTGTEIYFGNWEWKVGGGIVPAKGGTDTDATDLMRLYTDIGGLLIEAKTNIRVQAGGIGCYFNMEPSSFCIIKPGGKKAVYNEEGNATTKGEYINLIALIKGVIDGTYS